MDLKNSMLLANMMSKSGGGGAKTLALRAYNGASYDENYIYERSYSGIPPEAGSYFYTENRVALYSYDKSFEFKIKVLFSEGGSSPYRCPTGFTSTPFSLYFNAGYNIWTFFQGNRNSEYSANVNTWYYIKITKDANSNVMNSYVSTDGINYTPLHTYTITPDDTERDIVFGLGQTVSSAYNFNGKIDFSETDIKSNNRSILWV